MALSWGCSGVREGRGEGLGSSVPCAGSGLAASLEQQLGLECSGSVWGKGPEKLKVSQVPSTDIWENFPCEVCYKAAALSPVFSSQQTRRMFVWVLGLLKSPVEDKNLALSQQETEKFVFLLMRVIFVPLYSPQVVLQFGFMKILF